MIRIKKFINFIWQLSIAVGFQMPFYCAADWLIKTKTDYRAYIGVVCCLIAIFIVVQLSIQFRDKFKIFDL